MPLSSVLGAQSLVRPGVCTSSTRPASPFEGQLIFETDTNRVVAYDGSAWVYAVDTDQPPGLQLVKTQTIGTAVSSVTVTNAFSADFDNYLITIDGGVASTNIDLNMQLGSTTSTYRYSIMYMSYTSNTVNGLSGDNTTEWIHCGQGNTDQLNGRIMIFSPFASKHTVAHWESSRTGSGGQNTNGRGVLPNTTSYTDFKLNCNTGNMTGGTIRVYGYRNS